MAKRKNPVLLRVAIVALAVLLGMSLNAFQGKNPFKGLFASFQAPSREQADPAVPVGIPTAGAGESAPPVQTAKPAQALAGPAPEAGSAQTAGPSQLAQSSSAQPPAQPAPEAAARTSGGSSVRESSAKDTGQPAQESVSMASGQPSAEPAAQGAGHPSREAAADPAGQPALTPEILAQPRESTQPRIASSEGAVRSAKLGRLVPLEGVPAASGKESATHDQALPASAPDKPLEQKEGADRTQAPDKPGAPLQPGSSKPVTTPQPEMAGAGSTSFDTATPGQTAPPDKPAPQESPAPPDKPAPQEYAAAPENTAPSQKPPQQDKTGKHMKDSGGASQQADPNAAKPAKTGKLVEIKAQDKPGEVVLSIVTDMPPEKVTKFLAGKPSRFAVDLWGNWRGVDPASKEFDSELIERVRVGWHQDKIRVVIDYKEKEQPGLREPVIEVSDQGVMVRMAKPGKIKE